MVATILSGVHMPTSLVDQLKQDFPSIDFKPGKSYIWSPKDQTVIYKTTNQSESFGKWSLLHEIGHALLHHNTYNLDFELLQLEISAWEKAVSVSKKYGFNINQEHIQNCLDTYRDWLHQRSTCPICLHSGLQDSDKTYKCINCATEWQVSASRMCRPYRRLNHKFRTFSTPLNQNN